MVSLFFTKPAADNDSSSYISQQVEHRWYWLISLKLTTDTSFSLCTKDPNPPKFEPNIYCPTSVFCLMANKNILLGHKYY